MKKILIFACAMATALTASAKTAGDVENLYFESTGFHQTYYAGDGDWYVSISCGAYEFNFDIFGAPAEGLESGVVYTLEDMDTEYSFGIDYNLYEAIPYESCWYVETDLGAGLKLVEAQVQAVSGITYNISGLFDAADLPEYVQIPEGVQMMDYTLSCDDVDFGFETFNSQLGFDGNDVYFTNVGYVSNYFETAIKGTRDGMTLTFPAEQCVGMGSTGTFYLYGVNQDDLSLQDFVLNYDPKLGAYIGVTDLAVCSGIAESIYSYYEYVVNIVLTPNDPVAIRQLNLEAKAPVKRLENGKLRILSLDRKYNVAGQLEQ